MQTADVVNLILEKFGAKVRFSWIGANAMDVRIHPRMYRIGTQKLQVHEHMEDNSLNRTPFATWVEGVLNGGVRNDAGELVKQ